MIVDRSSVSGSDLHGFTVEGIAAAPSSSGIYVLFRRDRILMIGMSPDVRAALDRHRSGAGGARTRSATDFRVESLPAGDLDARQEVLLNEYRIRNNATVPVGNRTDVNRRLASTAQLA